MASSSSSSPEMSVPHSTNNTDPPLSTQAKLHEVLEDLSSRFILNLPDEELASLERVCFQVEQAHWYYEDFVREQDPSLPTMTLKKFSNSLFHVCPLLSHWGDDHEQTFQSFLAYKTRVPVCGAIMLNETWDKCLLVKGWKSTSAWSFPKGKINEQEPRHKCAVREVLEETGYDLEGQIDPTDVVELSIKDQSLSLYIVPNVPEDYPFETRTRKEISKISWFRLTDLPTWKRNKTVPGKFYLITPFIGSLRAFIRTRKPRDLPRRLHERQHPSAEPDSHISSEEDGHGDLDSHDAIVMAQESSSQSSSADNGDPHTPSPLYSEAIVNHAADGVDSEMQHTLNLDAMDPHFARLLSSLSLSVSTPSSTEVHGKQAANDGVMSGHQPTGRQSSMKQALMSSGSGPLPSTNKPNRSSRTPSAAAHTSPTLSSSATLQRPSSRLSRPSSPAVITSDHQRTRHHDAAHPSQSPPSRRPTVTADLSPYMSRANAAPAIPKQMKYITMLEHIAKESERMTPSLERQALASEYAWARGQRPVRNTSIPVPPAPPPPVMDGHSHPVYVPRGGDFMVPVTSVVQNLHGSSASVGPFPMDDPFIVRPRTTANYHQPSLSTRPSMSEDQLRSMMAGPRPTSTQPIGSYPPYPRNGVPVITPMGSQPLYPTARIQGPPLRVVPPHQLFPQSQFAESAPLSAPPISPTFNTGLRSNPANAQLLSILNAPSVPRTVPGIASGVPRTVGAR